MLHWYNVILFFYYKINNNFILFLGFFKASSNLTQKLQVY